MGVGGMDSTIHAMPNRARRTRAIVLRITSGPTFCDDYDDDDDHNGDINHNNNNISCGA